MRIKALPRTGVMLVLVVLLGMAALPVYASAQRVLMLSLSGGMLVMVFIERRLDKTSGLCDVVRVLVIFMGMFLTLRYLCWRLTNTVSWHGPFDFLAAVLFLAAELYSITVYFLGTFVSLQPRERRPVSLPKDDPEAWPTVDILVPSYNEDMELLEVTLLAATQVRYPPDRYHVYLLDDGATAQKRHDADPKKAQAALQRRVVLKALCKRVGARYLTRKRNECAKAGNINAALKRVDSDLVLILDADHVPTMDILEKTAGLFLKDSQLFLVQTKHCFLNPDPIEKNLDIFGRMPSENEMFYGVIQKGLDAWDASFFCGSAALIRRKYLDEVGGMQGSTVTEDVETSLALHAKGYHSAYLGHPMIAGLQPETFSGFIIQRVRWAQGMIQIFLHKNPWLNPGLSLSQKLCYTSSSFCWFFSLARSILLMGPLAYLLFGLRFYDANGSQFIIYIVPHLLGAILVSDMIYGKVRWSFISELYETIQALHLAPAIIRVLMHPKRPTFQVTPKGERLDEDYITSLARPLIVLTLVTLSALVAAVWRWQIFPRDHAVIVLTGLWTVFNLYILLAALGALLERQQRRATPRVDLLGKMVYGTLVCGESIHPVRIRDMSTGGLGIEIESGCFDQVRVGIYGHIHLTNSAYQRMSQITVRLESKQQRFMGVSFQPANQDEHRAIVALVYGCSPFLEQPAIQRDSSNGIWRAAGFLLRIGVTGFFRLLSFNVRQLMHVAMVRLRAMPGYYGWQRFTHHKVRSEQ